MTSVSAAELLKGTQLKGALSVLSPGLLSPASPRSCRTAAVQTSGSGSSSHPRSSARCQRCQRCRPCPQARLSLPLLGHPWDFCFISYVKALSWMSVVESFLMALAWKLGTDEVGGQTAHALGFVEQLSCLKRKKTPKPTFTKKHLVACVKSICTCKT